MMASSAPGDAPDTSARRLHPDDVLLALLTLAAPCKSERRVFPASSPKLHGAFHALLERPEALGLLDAFVPLQGAPYPYISQLARSLAHLERSRLVGKHNPDFERYFLEAAANEVYERRVKPRVSRVEGHLRQLSAEFWRTLDRADA